MAVVQSKGGNEQLIGTDFDDQIQGGPGSDTIVPGLGYDRLFGAAGDDVYVVIDRWDVIFESTGDDTALVFEDFVKPAEGVEHWLVQSHARPLPYWIDALVAEEALFAQRWLGSPKTFGYYFPSSPLEYFSTTDLKAWAPFTAAQQALVRSAFDYLEGLLDIRFVPTSNPYQANVISFSNNSQADTSGYAYLPSDASAGSDVFINATPANLNPGQWTFAALTLIHEIGHAIGLKHPFEDTNSTAIVPPVLSQAEDRTYWTVMSYTDQSYGFALKMAPLDIAALQYLYGPSTQLPSYDNSYFLNPNGTNFIWDNGGADTINGSSLTDPIYLSLNEGDWSWVKAKSDLITAAGQITINIGTTIESASTGSGADTVLGNPLSNRISLGQGNDAVHGLGGDDRLQGGDGQDLIDGGDGTDTAIFEKARSNYIVEQVIDSSAWMAFSALEGLSPGLSDAPKNDAQPGKLWRVTDRSNGSIDWLKSIEKLEFARTSPTDSTASIQTEVSLDVDGLAATAFRLYLTAYNRVPDLEGLGYWIGQFEVWSPKQVLPHENPYLREVAASFLSLPEFASRYPSALDNPGFVLAMYRNILGREPEASGLEYWTKVLQAYDRGEAAGASRADVLAYISESDENIVRSKQLISSGIEYLPYIPPAS